MPRQDFDWGDFDSIFSLEDRGTATVEEDRREDNDSVFTFNNPFDLDEWDEYERRRKLLELEQQKRLGDEQWKQISRDDSADTALEGLWRGAKGLGSAVFVEAPQSAWAGAKAGLQNAGEGVMQVGRDISALGGEEPRTPLDYINKGIGAVVEGAGDLINPAGDLLGGAMPELGPTALGMGERARQASAEAAVSPVAEFALGAARNVPQYGGVGALGKIGLGGDAAAALLGMISAGNQWEDTVARTGDTQAADRDMVYNGVAEFAGERIGITKFLDRIMGPEGIEMAAHAAKTIAREGAVNAYQEFWTGMAQRISQHLNDPLDESVNSPWKIVTGALQDAGQGAYAGVTLGAGGVQARRGMAPETNAPVLPPEYFDYIPPNVNPDLQLQSPTGVDLPPELEAWIAEQAPTEQAPVEMPAEAPVTEDFSEPGWGTMDLAGEMEAAAAEADLSAAIPDAAQQALPAAPVAEPAPIQPAAEAQAVQPDIVAPEAAQPVGEQIGLFEEQAQPAAEPVAQPAPPVLQPPQVERRAQKRVSEMTTEEKEHALLHNEKLGVRNRRYYEEDEAQQPTPGKAFADLNGLKAFNDAAGYAAGDDLLRTAIQTFREEGLEPYQMQEGDEFGFRGDPADLEPRLARARERLDSALLAVTLPDGTEQTHPIGGFEYGVGRDIGEATQLAKQRKEARAEAGEIQRGKFAEPSGPAQVAPQPAAGVEVQRDQTAEAERPVAARLPPPTGEALVQARLEANRRWEESKSQRKADRAKATKAPTKGVSATLAPTVEGEKTEEQSVSDFRSQLVKAYQGTKHGAKAEQIADSLIGLARQVSKAQGVPLRDLLDMTVVPEDQLTDKAALKRALAQTAEKQKEEGGQREEDVRQASVWYKNRAAKLAKARSLASWKKKRSIRASFGFQPNPRTVVELPGGKSIALGEITASDYARLAMQEAGDRETVEKWRQWYAEVMPVMAKAFGEKYADAMTKAFAIQSAKAGPSGAVLGSLRAAEDWARGLRAKWGGTPVMHEKVKEVLSGLDPRLGDRKVTDFYDAIVGFLGRRFYGPDVKSGLPAIIDRHQFHAMGYVSDVLVRSLTKMGADPKVLKRLKRDATGPEVAVGPHQYEAASEQMQQFTEELNRSGELFGIKDWTPKELQAVGWMAVLHLQSKKAETAQMALAENTYMVAGEIVPGQNAPSEASFEGWYDLPMEARREINKKWWVEADKVARELAGILFSSTTHSLGSAWLDYPVSPNAQVEVIASPEAARAYIGAMAYLLEQTKIIAFRPTDATSDTVWMVSVASKDFRTFEGTEKAWKRLREKLPGGLKERVTGFTPVRLKDGRVALQILLEDLKGDTVTGERDARAIENAIKDALQEFESENPVGVTLGRARLLSTENDWGKNRHGESHLRTIRGSLPGSRPDSLEHRRAEIARGIAADIQAAREGKPLAQLAEGEGQEVKALYIPATAGDAKAVMAIFKGADPSSALHEVFHHWLRKLPAQAREGLAKALGLDSAAKITVAEEEKAARAWEAYHREGVPPVEGVRKYFDAFSGWLKRVYTKLKGTSLEGKLTPEMREFFKSLYTEKKAEAKPVATKAPTAEFFMESAARSRGRAEAAEKAGKPETARTFLKIAEEAERSAARLRGGEVKKAEPVQPLTRPKAMISEELGWTSAQVELVSNALRRFGRKWLTSLRGLLKDAQFVAEQRKGRLEASGWDVMRYVKALTKEIDRLSKAGGSFDAVRMENLLGAANAILDGEKVVDGKVTLDREGEEVEVEVSPIMQKMLQKMRKLTDDLSTALEAWIENRAAELEAERDELVQEVVDDWFSKLEDPDSVDLESLNYLIKDYFLGEEGIMAEGIPKQIQNKLQQIYNGAQANEARNLHRLAEIIHGNKGKYITRAYKAFDDEGWWEKLRASDEFAKLKEQFRALPGMEKLSDKKLEEKMEEIARWRATPVGISGVGATGTIDIGVFMKRENVPEVVRKILGEYTDPRERWAKTMTILIRNVASYESATEMRDLGLDQGWISKTKKLGYREIPSKARRAPLGGLWVKEELYDIVTGEPAFEIANEAFTIFNRITALQKWGLTVGSIKAAVRNIIANPLLRYANGTYGLKSAAWNKMDGALPVGFINAASQLIKASAGGPLSEGEITKVLNANGVDLEKVELEELSSLVRDAIKYRVIKSSIEMQDLRTLFKVGEPQWSAATSLEQKFWLVFKEIAWTKPGQFWQFGDDVFKFAVWTETANQLLWTGQAKTMEEAKRMAADRTKDTMPDTDRMPRLWQMIRRVGILSNFITFITDVPRNLWNNLKIGTKDIQLGRELQKSDDKAKRQQGERMESLGARRVASTVAMVGVSQAAKLILLLMGGWLWDRKKKRSWFESSNFLPFLPQFYRGGQLVELPREVLGFDVAERGKAVLIDLSFMDPFGQLKRPFRRFITEMKAGRDARDAIAAAQWEIASPYLTLNITLATWEALYTGFDEQGREIYSDLDSEEVKNDKKWEFIRKRMGPGTAEAVRRVGAAKSRTELLGESLSFFGVRPIFLDMREKLPVLANSYTRKSADLTTKFQRTLSTEYSSEDRKKAYEAALASYRINALSLLRGIEGARQTELDDAEIASHLDRSSMNKTTLALAVAGELDAMVDQYEVRLATRWAKFETYGDDWRLVK